MTRALLTRLLLLGLLVIASAGCPAFHRGAMPGEPKQATFVELQGARVRYVDRGQGPAVVLIHGFASALETWNAVMPALESTHRVVALDLKGFGWTDRPEGDYSPEAQAELVLALLDHLGIERAAVIAHSWGCSVALAMALRAPERVSRLGLYDAWIYEEQLPTMFAWARTDAIGELLFALFYKERSDEKMAMAFYDPAILDEAFVEEVEAALDRPGTVASALAAVRGQRYEAVEARYGTIRQPVLLLWGREDRVTHLSFGERLASELGNAQLRIYPRCGHFPMIEAAAPSTRDLLAFMAEEHTASAHTRDGSQSPKGAPSEERLEPDPREEPATVSEEPDRAPAGPADSSNEGPQP